MHLKEVIERWKKPLHFKLNHQIGKDDLLKIIEAARWSPSASNQQVWRFLVIDDDKCKKTIIQSILMGDPRLTTISQGVKKPILRNSFIFSTENFNAKTDKYKDFIFEDNSDEENCAKTAATFIVCTHKSTRIGKAFGFLDMGAAISNMILISYDLGYHVRWFRKFNREFIREKFDLPKSIIIDAVVGIGEVDKLNNIPERELKKIYDFYFHNRWNEEMSEDYLVFDNSQFLDYNIEIRDVIVDRRSIRGYDMNKVLSKIKMLELLKAGLMVHLTINQPNIKLIIIDDETILKQVAKTSKIVIQQSHVQEVPLIAVATYDCSNNSAGFYAEIDTGAVIQNMLLRAHSLGIGSCWIGAFNRKIVRHLLDIPDNWQIPCLVIFGYPSKYPKPTPRLDLGKICYYNSWKDYIVKRHRTPLPDYHALSVGIRKFKNTHVKTILRSRKVGDVRGIPEFEKLRVKS
ncbi:MAG: nitroreductase family protein [Promethearchaeota archaeon]|jgi:nitroreductase